VGGFVGVFSALAGGLVGAIRALDAQPRCLGSIGAAHMAPGSEGTERVLADQVQ
jgi:hypothetical protein